MTMTINMPSMKRKSVESSLTKVDAHVKKRKIHGSVKKSNADILRVASKTSKPNVSQPGKLANKSTENVKTKSDHQTIKIKKNKKNKNSVSTEKKKKPLKKWKSWNKQNKKENGEKPAECKSEVLVTKRITIPKEISSNWKVLSQTIQKKEKDKKPSSLSHKSSTKIIKVKTNDLMIDTKAESDSLEPDIWFDDVDEMLLDIEARKAKRKRDEADVKDNSTSNTEKNPFIKTGSFEGLTKVVAMDCEMVGVGLHGNDNMLARVSIVNKHGACLYDKYVKPMEKVVDYRTFVSGITPENIADGEEFFTVQKEVSEIIKGKLLVGHAIINDLKVLYLQHDKKNIRDTSKYKGYRSLFGFKTPSLKKLTKEVLGVSIQEGEHDSVIDAQAAMRLYTMYRKQWEKDINMQKKKKHIKKLQDNAAHVKK